MSKGQGAFRRSCRLAAFCGVAAALFAAAPVLAHDGTEHEDAGAPQKQRDSAQVKVTLADVELIDQNRNRLNFQSDALADRIVVIDFIYTTCTTICPITSSILAQVQAMLGNRMEETVRLVTVSIDPLRDTPGRMKDSADKYGAAAGWYWLTGAKHDVERLLKGLGAYTPDIVSHPPMILVGDPANDRWLRLFGFASPDEILAKIEILESARGTSQSSMRTGG